MSSIIFAVNDNFIHEFISIYPFDLYYVLSSLFKYIAFIKKKLCATHCVNKTVEIAWSYMKLSTFKIISFCFCQALWDASSPGSIQSDFEDWVDSNLSLSSCEFHLLIGHTYLKSRWVHQVTISELQFLPCSIARLINMFFSLSASLILPLESENT